MYIVIKVKMDCHKKKHEFIGSFIPEYMQQVCEVKLKSLMLSWNVTKQQQKNTVTRNFTCAA